jgi:hypothetical protein
MMTGGEHTHEIGYRLSFGSHSAWTEGEDVLHIAWRGNVSGEDITAGGHAFERVPNREGGFFLVLHLADMGRFSPAARTAITKDPRSAWVREVVVVGAPFHMRVVLGMVSKALYALGVNKARTVFVDSEAEARAHLARRRR